MYTFKPGCRYTGRWFVDEKGVKGHSAGANEVEGVCWKVRVSLDHLTKASGLGDLDVKVDVDDVLRRGRVSDRSVGGESRPLGQEP